ncbi:MAG TPA: helix-turn-helix domain-containing protein, partial [Solirubrobacterales bacterium]
MADLDGKKLKQVIDPTLAKAFTHPLRGHVWVTLFERGEASPSDIASELGLKVDDVDYHFRELARRGLIKLIRTQRGQRGFDKHVYEPVAPALNLDDAKWMELPKEVRVAFSGEMVRQLIQGITAALEAGSFDARDRHLSQSWVLVDEQGWGELMAAAQQALERFLAIGELAGARRKTTGEAGIPVCLMIAAFETADSMSRRQAGESEELERFPAVSFAARSKT